MDKKKVFQLKNGLLELTYLRDGALVLGEIKSGFTGKEELQVILEEANLTHGLIQENIDQLKTGSEGQLPLALAYSEDEAPKVDLHFDKIYNEDIFMKLINQGGFVNDFDYLCPVAIGDRLLTIISPPKSVMRYPDGRKVLLKTLSLSSQLSLAGKNTHFDYDSNSLISNIDGSAHRSPYGIVSVYPIKPFRSIGKMHGDVYSDTAIVVERDVQRESNIEIPSNLIVNGAIKSSQIHAGGNVQAVFGLDNSLKLEEMAIHAGQSIITSSINHYEVWAGMHILVNTSIQNSIVQCMNTIVVPEISACEVRIGSKLYTRNIREDTQIFLGSNFVMDENIKGLKSFYYQHSQRVNDFDDMIQKKQAEIRVNREKAITQIKKLRRLQKENYSQDMVLNRFYGLLQESLEETDEYIRQYREAIDLIQKDRIELAFYDRQLNFESQPEIIVSGTIEKGTVIVTPTQTIKVNNTLQNVRIRYERDNNSVATVPLLQN